MVTVRVFIGSDVLSGPDPSPGRLTDGTQIPLCWGREKQTPQSCNSVSHRPSCPRSLSPQALSGERASSGWQDYPGFPPARIGVNLRVLRGIWLVSLILRPNHKNTKSTKDLNMKLAGLGTGLLINFNVRRLRDGIKRFVL